MNIINIDHECLLGGYGIHSIKECLAYLREGGISLRERGLGVAFRLPLVAKSLQKG
jgi:hypothetical protein